MDWVQLISLILFYLLSSQHYLIISSLQHFIALGKQVWIDFILIYPASSFHPSTSTSTSTSPYLLLLYPQFIVFLLVITFTFPLLIHFQLTHLLHFLFLNLLHFLLLHFLLLHLLICFLLTLLCCLHYCLNFHSFTILFHWIFLVSFYYALDFGVLEVKVD